MREDLIGFSLPYGGQVYSADTLHQRLPLSVDAENEFRKLEEKQIPVLLCFVLLNLAYDTAKASEAQIIVTKANKIKALSISASSFSHAKGLCTSGAEPVEQLRQGKHGGNAGQARRGKYRPGPASASMRWLCFFFIEFSLPFQIPERVHQRAKILDLLFAD
jgi:hypothetical protein